eukprot:scaffold76291_cov63-Phaeocystis_antarctica.AAC.4
MEHGVGAQCLSATVARCANGREFSGTLCLEKSGVRFLFPPACNRLQQRDPSVPSTPVEAENACCQLR